MTSSGLHQKYSPKRRHRSPELRFHMCRINGRRTLQAEKLHIFSSACIKWLVPTVLCGNLCLCAVTAGTASLDKKLTRNRGLSPSTHSYKHALRPHIKTSGRKEVRDKYILLPESTLTLNFQVHTNTIWAYFTCVRPSHTIPLSCSLFITVKANLMKQGGQLRSTNMTGWSRV